MKLSWLPNAISITRLFLIIPYGWLFFYLSDTRWPFLFAFVIILADKLDGTLARKLNAESKLGTALDTIADDAFLIASWVFFFVQGFYGLAILILILLPRIFVRISALVLRLITKKWHIEHLFGDRLGAIAQYVGILWILARFAHPMEILYGLIVAMYLGAFLSIFKRVRLARHL